MKIPFIPAAAALALAIAPAVVASGSTTSTPAKTRAKKEMIRSRWPAENVSGRIDRTDPSQKLLIVKGDQTIFDFVVTPRTKILDGNQKVSLADLMAKNNGQVTVHFIPERKGDVAASIELSQ